MRSIQTITITTTIIMFLLILLGISNPASAAGPTHGTAKVTFYCASCNHSHRIADPHRRTSSPMGVAADPRYHPIGTLVAISGFGVRRVDDTGGAIKGPNRFDIRLASRGKCQRFGVKRLRYRVVSHPHRKRHASATAHRKHRAVTKHRVVAKHYPASKPHRKPRHKRR